MAVSVGKNARKGEKQRERGREREIEREGKYQQQIIIKLKSKNGLDDSVKADTFNYFLKNWCVQFIWFINHIDPD